MRELALSGQYGQGRFALVDARDYVFLCVFTWLVDTRGYVVRPYRDANGKKHSLYLHQMVLNKSRGLVIDHINHNKLDNRKSNLRLVTVSENVHNSQRKLPPSGYRGVYKFKNESRWMARIQVRKELIHLGSFDSPEKASEAYEAFRLVHVDHWKT